MGDQPKPARTPSKPDLSVEDLKLCALCGALNHRSNPECFTCGWRGVFDTNEPSIRMARGRIIDQYGRITTEDVTRSGSTNYLADIFSNGNPVSPRTFWLRAVSWWVRIFRKLF